MVAITSHCIFNCRDCSEHMGYPQISDLFTAIVANIPIFQLKMGMFNSKLLVYQRVSHFWTSPNSSFLVPTMSPPGAGHHQSPVTTMGPFLEEISHVWDNDTGRLPFLLMLKSTAIDLCRNPDDTYPLVN